MSKYCAECGNKCEAANGQPAKFCGNCGHPLGFVKTSASKTVQIVEPIIAEDIEAGDLFEIQGSRKDVNSFSFEKIVNTGRSGASRRSSPKSDVKTILGGLKQQNFDAE